MTSRRNKCLKSTFIIIIINLKPEIQWQLWWHPHRHCNKPLKYAESGQQSLSGYSLFLTHQVGLVESAARRTQGDGFLTEVKQQPDNSVPRPKPINIPQCAAPAPHSDQHTRKLRWRPRCRSEINFPIVCTTVAALRRVTHKRYLIWLFRANGCRKTTRRTTKTT